MKEKKEKREKENEPSSLHHQKQMGYKDVEYSTGIVKGTVMCAICKLHP